MSMIEQSDFTKLNSVISKIEKGDHGYFVFGNETEPYYKHLLITSDVYEVNDTQFFTVEEKYPVKAHTEELIFYDANGNYGGTKFQQIVDEWATNVLTLNVAKWLNVPTSKNLIFKDQLDAAAYVVWLRELNSDVNE